jgi:hypothetical protein
MDLKAFYQKLRSIETNIIDPFVLLVSNATADGGKEGVRTETPRAIAARLLLEGAARLASAEEAAIFQKGVAEAQRLAQQAAAASKIQVTVVADGTANQKPAEGQKSPKA